MTEHSFPETYRTLRRLILLRHAKAKAAALGGDDFERPLTERGRADAALIGRLLAADGLVPDRVLLSSSRRTAETWAQAQIAFPGVAGDARRGLYLADARTLLQAIEEEDEGEVVMVIGHNPGIHALAVNLLRQGSAAPSTMAKFDRGFPTATAAVFAIDQAGRASYDGLYLVSEHGGGGPE
jgi:phosphohistidine phosphatase